ncbi:MAG TPA: MG2 domain-containing protein, partial [Lacipirellulaceae bacterium]|nr:MG2 domain-containing protein [Lacipirellulaceae bacterium]
QRTPEAAALASGLASALMHGGYAQAWRLQTLTSLGELPDYEEGYGYHGAAPRGAPVDDEGRPVFYEPPASWDAAQNDGQRWRWTLARRTAWQPDALRRELRERADFLRSQFSVRTMADYGWWFARPDDDADVAKSTFDLPSLGENETIARLATGIQRLTLPDEHNFLKLLRRVAGDSTQGDGDWSSALATMAEELEDRRQLPRAAELWRELLAGSPNNSAYMDRLTQITGNWGRIEPATTQRAGRGATFDYRYRNGQRVDFTARPVKVRQLLDDVKAYLSSNPRQLNWQQVNLDQLGHRLVVEGQDKYLEAESARWSLDLDPRPGHADRRVTVTTPLQRPGAYLVTASIEGGNAHRVVVWVADTAIVKKPMQGKALYYVADAVTGKPIPRCNVEFFGFSQQHIAGTNDFRVSTKNFAELTNADGLVELPAVEDNRRSWLAIATTAGAPARAGAETEPPRLAYLGFSGVWSGDYFDQEYQQVKVYTMTDRPVYRPGQQVHFKFWVATAKFDQGDASSFAAQSFAVEIHDPRGQKVYAKSLVADSFGGLGDTLQLPAGATLGQYQLMVVNHGGGAFRVEEYKKPEYEVQIDAPGDPVTLGDKVTATIRANYYFGAPVTQARVKYKVLRTTHDQPWFPPSPWDWLFGRGYAWIAEGYSWNPGWSRWGSVRPAPPWLWRPAPPPGVVIESEADLGPDGTLQVEIDTAPAKELHGASDHRYEIVADVVDASRRSIVASGEVLAARVPFRVFVWAHRGYYSTGDSIELEMAARRLDGKPVRGDGVLRLLRIAYEEGKPVESEVAKWTVAADARGRAKLQIRAGEPGQYRVSYEVTAQRADGSSGPKQEGAQLLVVRGAGFDGTGFRFNSVEIVPDKTHYAPGEKARLQVSANRIGAAVLLFVRPSNGVYQAPQLVRLIGKSTTVELDVTARDMPNFFVEAVSVHSGRMHTAVREIFVPPTRRVFNVEVKPSAEAYLPGERAKVAIKLTDPDGKPVAGSTVVAIYDRALDYIAGPLQRPDIREFFWK